MADELTGSAAPVASGAGLLAGVDEAGRGPLAGDVVAAAVILDPKRPIRGLADSKRLSAARREQLYQRICECSRAWSVGRAAVAEIDEINILQATFLAMCRAVQGLALEPVEVWVDGNRLPDWHYRSRAIIGGDASVAQISAASIVAKVVRDRDMDRLDAQYPGYGFARNRGYPTSAHKRALAALGASPVHRRSFRPVAEAIARHESG